MGTGQIAIQPLPCLNGSARAPCSFLVARDFVSVSLPKVLCRLLKEVVREQTSILYTSIAEHVLQR